MSSTGDVLTERIVVGFSGRPRAVLASGHAQRTVAAMEPRTYLWQLWAGRNWPSTAAEELVFIDDLRAFATRGKAGTRRRAVTWERHDLTAVLNALRCGLTAAQLMDRAPGLRAARLVASYEALEALRQRAVTAWTTIVTDRSLEALVSWSEPASVLMPVPVRQMTPSSDRLNEEQLAQRIEKVVTSVQRRCAEALEVEERMGGRQAPDALGVELGRMLYDPYAPALWGDPLFLPNRVGTLVPVRVADLLGERRN